MFNCGRKLKRTAVNDLIMSSTFHNRLVLNNGLMTFDAYYHFMWNYYWVNRCLFDLFYLSDFRVGGNHCCIVILIHNYLTLYK